MVSLTCLEVAAQLVTAGVFVAFGFARNRTGTLRNRWRWPQCGDTLRPTVSFWIPAYLPWIADAERVQLFVFLVASMARFVVLHELGHIHFGHGRTEGSSLQ